MIVTGSDFFVLAWNWGEDGLIGEMKHVWRGVVVEKARFSSNPCYYMNETFVQMPFPLYLTWSPIRSVD